MRRILEKKERVVEPLSTVVVVVVVVPGNVWSSHIAT